MEITPGFKEFCFFVPLISQASSGHKSCWTTRRRLTTGSPSTRRTAAWRRAPPSSRSTSKCRTSTTTRRRPRSPSTTPPSWRTRRETCRSSRSMRSTRTPRPATNSATGSPAAIPRVSLPSPPGQVRPLFRRWISTTPGVASSEQEAPPPPTHDLASELEKETFQQPQRNRLIE